jgi:hypothetical protein
VWLEHSGTGFGQLGPIGFGNEVIATLAHDNCDYLSLASCKILSAIAQHSIAGYIKSRGEKRPLAKDINLYACGEITVGKVSTDESVQNFSHYWVVPSTCSTDTF